MRQPFLRSTIATLVTVLCLGLVVDLGPTAVFGASEADAPTRELAAALDSEADAHTMGRYIFVLDDPPLASYRGGIPGLAPTAVDTAGGKIIEGKPSVHLDVASPAAEAYLAFLERQQETMLRKLRYMAPEIEAQDWRYSIVTNGFVARMTSEHAAQALRLEGMRLVYPAQELFEEMDSTNTLLGTVHAWEAAGGVAEAGLGARVAILEAGNAVLHDFFNDEGMPDPPDGYPSATIYLADGTEVDMLALSANPEALVNNKTIGYRVFASSMSDAAKQTWSNGGGLSGHGSHVSGTVAGRYGSYEIAPGIEVDMGGMAPNAWVFNYPVNGDTPEMIKAFELMAVEEIDAVNLSLGTATWLMDRPETHPVSVAMTGAADAGVLVVGSAGNAGGNGRTSLSGGWKYSEDLMVVGNTSSTGRNGRLLEVTQDDVPDRLKSLLAGVRGAPYTSVITGTLAFRDDGGCEPSPDVTGKIAVVERFDPSGTAIGPCGYTQRAEIMASSGAKGIIYIYYNQIEGGDSTTALAIPGLALGVNGGVELVEWLEAGNTVDVTMSAETIRDYAGTPDVLAASSSQGPGIDWTIKPDISAPGTNILSSVLTDADTTDNLPPAVSTWPAFSGTSMAAPHITGAAGLLRSMHPDWTVPQLRSALINTSIPSIITGDLADPRPADPTEGGPGRVNMKDAHDPRAFLYPPKASFGAVGPDEQHEIEIEVEGAYDEAITWDLTMEPATGDVMVSVEPETITVRPGETVSVTVRLDTTGATMTEHYGDIVLSQREKPGSIYLPMLLSSETIGEEEPGILGGEAGDKLGAAGASPDALDHEGEDHEAELRSLRLVWYAYVDDPAARDDVLIIDWTYGETEDYTSYYTDVLDELGLTWNVWGLGEAGEHAEDVAQSMHPTFEAMYGHEMVILNANESQVGLQEAGLAGGFQYLNVYLGGGNVLIAGQGTQGWWRYLTNGSANPLADTPNNRANYPDTWPYTWGGPSQNVGCEMCIARYFSGYTPVLTSTLSGRLLFPYPMAPDRPEMDVLLPPHPEAEGVFDYGLDISTGAMAKDGAAGNQYQFNSGQVISGPVDNVGRTPADVEDGMIVARTVPYARPIWSYTVPVSTTEGMTETLLTVGTYVAGKQHEDGPAWNAMYWGFGLEGVGENGEGTASRSRLLGDTYNFMAKNMAPEGGIAIDSRGRATLTVDLGPKAEPVRFSEARIDWGQGKVETLRFDDPRGAEALRFAHDYGSRAQADARTAVAVTLIPVRGEAAPVYLNIDHPTAR